MFLPVPSDILNQLYRRHAAELHRYLRIRFGAGPPEPEDVVQAAFVQFAQLDYPERISNPAAFLRTTARNIAIDAHRQAGRTAIVLATVETGAQNRAEIDAENVLSSKQELARVDMALASLKPQQRVAFLMHRVDGLSYAAIGTRLGISESGARKLVRRAFDACTKALRQQEAIR